jgi:anti-sigma factor RsiW
MNTDRISKTDRELWQSVTTGPEVASAAVSDMEFAAWLEGRLSEAEAARIEASVAADPELRRAALELSDILGKPLPAAPARMAVRAQALVGFEVERQAGARGWLSGLLSIAGSFAVPRAALATMVLMVAAGGFMMGGGLGESYAHEKNIKVASLASTGDNSNELTAFFSTDGL